MATGSSLITKLFWTFPLIALESDAAKTGAPIARLEEGERVIDTLTPDQRRFFLGEFYSRQGSKESDWGKSNGHVGESDADQLARMFWHTIERTFSFAPGEIAVGIRKDWVVVGLTVKTAPRDITERNKDRMVDHFLTLP